MQPVKASLLVIAFVAVCAAVALGSQAPGHFYVARRALEGAPPGVQALLNANMGAYLAGATGPDIALTTYLIAEALDIAHPGSEAHYDRTGQLIMNMLSEARKLGDPVARDAGIAFALGWLTHYCTDCVIHPLINDMGGYFGGGHDRQVRHKHLELVECEHVLAKSPNPQSETISAFDVPIELILRAFRETFPDKSIYQPNILTPALLDFRNDLAKSALIMGQATQFFANVHNGDLAWRGPVISIALKGYPPTKDEYARLLEPLRIDDVEAEIETDASGNKDGKLKVTYTINDLRLISLFCKRWDQVIGQASANAISYFNAYETNPSALKVFDRNLDTGGPIASSYDTATEWPGAPKIESMLVFATMKDKNGKEILGWPADGKWAPIAIVNPALASAGVDTLGIIREEKGWNDGKAGQAFFTIPFDASKPGPYEVELRLAFADRATKKLYGWPNDGVTVEATWRGEVGTQEPELSIMFLVDCSGSMGGQKIEDARSAVKASVDTTDDGKTEWCLARFGGCSVNVICRFTMDGKKVKAAADLLSASGDTPLTYARAKALSYLASRGRGKTGRLIILCDGQDNCPEHGAISQPEASAQLLELMRVVQPAATAGGVSGGAR